MINKCLINCVDQLNTHFAGLNCEYPFISYTPETQLLSLYAPKAFFDPALANPVSIWFNEPMSIVLLPFPYESYNYSSSNGKDKKFVLENDHDLNVVSIKGVYSPTIQAILYKQPFTDFGYMNALRNILITTNMNVNSERYFVNNPSAKQNINYINVLTDYLPDLSTTKDAGIASKIFIYNASSLWRVFTFNQTTPLYNITLGVKWLDNIGNTWDLNLKKGVEVNVKLMFIKKSAFSKFLL